VRLRRAAFLDRDGTLIVERHYLSDPGGVELIPGVVEALGRLRESGHALVVVTNQSGLARGLITPEEYERVTARFIELLGAGGIELDGIYHCPHHPDHSGPCRCRKPGTELFEIAAGELGLDLARSLYVGDRIRDLVAALEFGGRGYLVRTGYGASEVEIPAEIGVASDLRGVVEAYLGGLT